MFASILIVTSLLDTPRIDSVISALSEKRMAHEGQILHGYTVWWMQDGPGAVDEAIDGKRIFRSLLWPALVLA